MLTRSEHSTSEQRTPRQRLSVCIGAETARKYFSLVLFSSLGIIWRNKIKVFPKVAQVHYGPENHVNILQNTLKEYK